jgi:hypothetical protein
MQSNEARSCAGRNAYIYIYIDIDKTKASTLALLFVVGVLRARLANVSIVFFATTQYLSQPRQDRCRSPLLDADLCRARAACAPGRGAISLPRL